jgi:hypothetical protein
MPLDSGEVYSLQIQISNGFINRVCHNQDRFYGQNHVGFQRDGEKNQDFFPLARRQSLAAKYNN